MLEQFLSCGCILFLYNIDWGHVLGYLDSLLEGDQSVGRLFRQPVCLSACLYLSNSLFLCLSLSL